MELVDVHAHITDEQFNDVENVIARAKEQVVNKIICSSADLMTSQMAINLADKYQEVFANVGIHPESADDFVPEQMKKLKGFAGHKKVVAIGEIGLDYHYTQNNKDKQKMLFTNQIELANELDLPIVVHSRDAMADTIEILSKNPPKKESLLHCYSGSVESAKILMGLNFSFSFGGVVTFANAKTAVEVVRFLPIEKILLETDCPYLSPVPFRGKRNEPKNVVYVADMIARIKGMKFEDVVEITTRNAKRLFNI